VLVLFTRERKPGAQILTKTTLPEPLHAGMAMIQPHRPAPIGTYALILQPVKTEEIVELGSQQRRDGRWKNHTSRGVPICVQFESHERGRLEQLRQTLFGQSAAGRAQAQDDRLEKSRQQMEKLQQHMSALAPEQQQAAMLQMALKMRETLPFAGLVASEGMPAEAAHLSELLQQKLQEFQQRAQEAIARVDPETQRLLEEMLRRRLRPGDDTET
jgi:hypothetical protein